MLQKYTLYKIISVLTGRLILENSGKKTFIDLKYRFENEPRVRFQLKRCIRGKETRFDMKFHVFPYMEPYVSYNMFMPLPIFFRHHYLVSGDCASGAVDHGDSQFDQCFHPLFHPVQSEGGHEEDAGRPQPDSHPGLQPPQKPIPDDLCPSGDPAETRLIADIPT